MTAWDQRYDRDEYVYGLDANEFLISVASAILPGPVLCLGEGEGRNAVFLAEKGFPITAVDGSRVALKKAEQLARQKNVSINTVVSDLADYQIDQDEWMGIVYIFCHLHRDLRKIVHRACCAGLKRGGVFILEGFTPAQLDYNTGGPKSFDLLMTADELRGELSGLEIQVAQEVVRDRREGLLHTGLSAVVQILAIKP
ncbi:MAG: methyltransferase domain-containing protein [Calditrichaeota bacterium]|nr:MAG: methyltransferase domain-containing protein [Calditrichota bacterium]